MRLVREIALAVRGGPRIWADALISTWELAAANRTLRRTPSGKLALLPVEQPQGEPPPFSLWQTALVERVAYVLPRMAARVPWRSDCLVQALAARRWLARAGVASDVCVGVRKDEQGFQAHAWLRVGERIVTGGDISSYAELPAKHSGLNRFSRWGS